MKRGTTADEDACTGDIFVALGGKASCETKARSASMQSANARALPVPPSRLCIKPANQPIAPNKSRAFQIASAENQYNSLNPVRVDLRTSNGKPKFPFLRPNGQLCIYPNIANLR